MFRDFTLTTDDATLVTCFELKEMPPFAPKYHIAPGDQVATVPASMQRTPRIVGLLDWGLIFDEKDVAQKEERVTKVHEDKLKSPTYEPLFRFKRCLILADGLFVWKLDSDVPKYLVRRDHQPFAFAGLRHRFAKGEESWDTCAIITIEPNGGVEPAQVMPALVKSQDFDKWISPMVTKVVLLKTLLAPLPLGEMESRDVGDHVKDVNDKLPHCIDERQ
jgi:putative SOS response-associated peptidase YedK